MKRIWNELAAEIVIGVLILGLLVFMFLIAYARIHADNHDLFDAWMKLHPTAELSYEDWNKLYQHHILPGQSTGRYNE